MAVKDVRNYFYTMLCQYIEEKQNLSVLRVGYADGFLRSRQNGVHGWENQANCLCMDACMRFGEMPKGRWIPILIDADETAMLAHTISYEVLCAATRRAEFIYDNNEVAICGDGRNPENTT